MMRRVTCMCLTAPLLKGQDANTKRVTQECGSTYSFASPVYPNALAPDVEHLLEISLLWDTQTLKHLKTIPCPSKC